MELLIIITPSSRHRQVVGSLEDAVTLLLGRMNSLPVAHKISKKAVEEILDQPSKPAVITTPFIRYRRPQAEEISNVAATIDQLGQQFIWKIVCDQSSNDVLWCLQKPQQTIIIPWGTAHQVDLGAIFDDNLQQSSSA